MSEYLCRLCGAHYHGTHTCNGTGNFQWIDVNKIDELQAHIAQLTSENEKLTLENRSLNYQLNASIMLKISAIRSYTDAHEQMVIGLKSELKDWKADAERLAETFMFEDTYDDTGRDYWVCDICYATATTPSDIEHEPDCPITLHRELVAKYKESK